MIDFRIITKIYTRCPYLKNSVGIKQCFNCEKFYEVLSNLATNISDIITRSLVF